MKCLFRTILLVLCVLAVLVTLRSLPPIPVTVAVAAPSAPSEIRNGAIVNDQPAISPRAGALVPAPPVSQAVAIGPSDFRPVSSATQFECTSGILLTSVSINNGFFAHLLLPQGARITSVTWYVYDADANEDVRLEMRNTHPETGMADLEGTIYTSGSDGNVRSFSMPVDVLVDNASHSYNLYAELAAVDTQRIHGARVYYTPSTSYLPAIVR